MDLHAAADALIEAGRRLGARGLISASEGNLSLRLDADRLLITPSGRRKDELDRDDLVVIWLGHATADAMSRSGLRPSSDLAIHLAVHAARPELGAVAHAHLPASMALTLAGEIPDPGALPETAHFIPRLPYLAYGVMGSDELADASQSPCRRRPSRWPMPSCSNDTAHRAVGRSRRRPSTPGARRGALPDVARRAPDSRSRGRDGIVDRTRSWAPVEEG